MAESVPFSNLTYLADTANGNSLILADAKPCWNRVNKKLRKL